MARCVCACETFFTVFSPFVWTAVDVFGWIVGGWTRYISNNCLAAKMFRVWCVYTDEKTTNEYGLVLVPTQHSEMFNHTNRVADGNLPKHLGGSVWSFWAEYANVVPLGSH